MTAAAPWSVKGIDPRTREVAKDLARRSGMTLGEWLNTVIAKGETTSPSAQPSPPRREALATPATAAAAQAGEVARLASALERLTRRIEAAEQRSSSAISGVDQSVMGVLARLDSVERDHGATAARLQQVEQTGPGPAGRSVEALKSLESALGKVAGQLYEGEARHRSALDTLSSRIDELATAPAPSLDALAGHAPNEAISGVIDRISERLERAETQTTVALNGLQSSFAGLDQRLRAAEARPAKPGTGVSEARLEALATELTARVEDGRVEMAQTLEQAVGTRFDQIEAVVDGLTGQVDAAERRSQQAIEKMGYEVLRVAETLGRRMISVENRTADAVEQVGGEVARIAGSMEHRLRASDIAHAEALERLGGEIAKISEKLADRIAAAERRSAQSIEDVGEQVTRTNDKLTSRYEAAANDLADRIRQSEERTARFLEEARETIGAQLSETRDRIAEQVAPGRHGAADVQSRLGQTEATDTYMPPFGKMEPSSTEPLEPFSSAASGPVRARLRPPAGLLAKAPTPAPTPAPEPPPLAPAVISPVAVTPAAPPAPEEAIVATPSTSYSGFDDDAFGAADDFLGETARVAALDAQPEPVLTQPVVFDAEPDFPEFEPEPELELIDEHDEDADPAPVMSQPEPLPPTPSGPLTTRDVLERARASVKASMAAAPPPRARNGFFAQLDIPGRVKAMRQGGTLRTALIASATAAALSVFAASWMIFAQGDADGGVPASAIASVDAPTSRAQTATLAGPPRVASLQVRPAESAVVTPLAQVQNDEAAAIYRRAAGLLESGESARGVTELKRAANLGYAPAQLHLASLFESGASGVNRDVGEARRWTERAAQGGDRRAMHNLGLIHFEGSNGPKNATLAAQWFRRAAEQGLTDSQFNLGLVNERGYGVTRNPAEAYKWYLISARGGDAEGRSAAVRLERTLSADAKAAAERSALSFRTPAALQVASALSTTIDENVVAAQRALSRLGYYQGPTDGRSSPALVAAVAAWQTASGQQADGVIDPAVVAGLNAAG